FLRLGLLGFGGPVALVGQMERELVGEKQWVTKEQMRETIAVCQSLPAPLAIQVGIYISYLRAGFWGAWAGGWAFIFPNFVIVAALGALYVRLGDLPAVTAVFYGVSPAVIALILHSLLPAGKARNGGPGAVGARGRLPGRYCRFAGRGSAAFHWSGYCRDPVLRQSVLWFASRSAGAGGSCRRPSTCSARAGCIRIHPRQFALVLPQGRSTHIRQRPGDRAVFAAGTGAAIRLARRSTILDRGRGGHDQSRTRGHHGNLRRLPRGWLLGFARLHNRNFLALLSFGAYCGAHIGE